jgi:carboxymethylenebutenolidase
MATMTDDPVVMHVPTSIGARGRTEVRGFYADYFIDHQAQDMRLELVSRTATADRVVDEMTISFTTMLRSRGCCRVMPRPVAES